LPVIAFGEQLSRDTDGSLSTVETLASTAICGIIHSIIGGQPLLILGVAEPTVIMYTYLYSFCKSTPDLGPKLFLAWAGWVCVWTALFLILLAIFNACDVISRFTRIAEELFGMLITVLFFQEAIKGLIGEFGTPKAEKPSSEELQPQWRFTNGLLAIIFAFGLIVTARKSRTARSWQYGTRKLRGFIADYGVAVMVVLWTAVSYLMPSYVPDNVIGVMTAISAEREYIRDGKVTKMVVIELTDSSGKCECALCGDYVDDLSKKVGKTASGIPVVVIQFAKVKIFRGAVIFVKLFIFDIVVDAFANV
ncbi:boron transporter 4-like protein, partial [Trifolium pratense]